MDAVVAGERPLADVVARLDARDPWAGSTTGGSDATDLERLAAM